VFARWCRQRQLRTILSHLAKTVEEESTWDRLIYVPFTELRKVFNNQQASAVIPYEEYVRLMNA